MSITLIPFHPQPSNELPVRIEIGGKIVGEVRPSDCGPSGRYHAAINIPSVTSTIGLIQGHGATREEAIEAAFAFGARNAQAVLDGIVRLQAQISEAG